MNYFVICFSFREKVGVKTVKALKRKNEAVTHAAVDMLCTLMQVKLVVLIFVKFRHSTNKCSLG